MPKSLDQTFSYRNLLRMRRKEDASLFPQRAAIRGARIKALASDLEAGNFAPRPFKQVVTPKGFSLFWTDSYQDALVLRKINDSIRRLYRVRFSERTAIVRQVRSLLSEGAPKQIIRIDLASFYENVDRGTVVEKLTREHLLSPKTKRLLNLYFDTAFPGLGGGLPRGICLSSTLAELALREFDSAVRRIPGVYFYARYVDDIVVFTFTEANTVRDKIRALLPQGLVFNARKSAAIYRVRACRCEPRCVHPGTCPCRQKRLAGFPCPCRGAHGVQQVLTFLGYRFAFSDVANKRGPAEVMLSIADSKVKKIKTRIIFALRDFAKGGDFDLLQDRLQFLAGNYTVRVASNDKRVKAGIYYNYRLLDPAAGETHDVLHGLNEFLRSALFSRTLRFVAGLTRDQREVLSRISFVSGFQSRRLVKLLPQRVYQVKRCWQHE